MYVKNYNGEEFYLNNDYTVKNHLNGNQTIDFTAISQDGFEHVKRINKLWTVVDHQDVEYIIHQLNRKSIGNEVSVDITGVPMFFDVLDTNSIDNRYDGSLTAFNSFSRIFANTNFEFVLVDSFNAVEWENFGGDETKLESFKRAIERYKCEFEIIGNTVYLRKLIGRDTQHQYRKQLNADNIVQSIDASGFYTYIKGYANYESDDDYKTTAKLKREYTSPYAKIVGLRHAPNYKDGRIKNVTTLDNNIKTIVDESLKVSFSADITDLSNNGYPIAQSMVGDRVFLIDETIEVNEEIRVVETAITRNRDAEIIDVNLTFGSDSIGKRYQSNLNGAVSNIDDILNGRKEIPLSSLDKRVQEISKIINGNTDSIFEYASNGVTGWNGDDPNYMTRYVGDAIGFSTDGGTTYGTAMSAKLGIVADYIRVGTLSSIVIKAVEIYGSRIEGTDLIGGTILSQKTTSEYLKIEGSHLVSHGVHDRKWMGEAGNNTVRLMLENGQVRARNDDKNWSLYFNDYGISTFSDGSGAAFDSDASGIIEFHSTRYSDGDYKGLTISSGGRLALQSNNPTGSRIYINPQGASVRISDLKDNYYNIAAASFVQSSHSNLKRDIKPLQDDALQTVLDMDFMEWKRLTNGKSTPSDKWQAGLILQEAPPQMIDGTGVDLYTYTTYIGRAVQQLYEMINKVETDGAVIE